MRHYARISVQPDADFAPPFRLVSATCWPVSSARQHTVTRVRACLFIASGIALVVFALAFFVAPWACTGGLEFYFWCGAAAVLLMLALPFITRMRGSLLVRAGSAFGFAVLGAGAWLAGLLVANVRFICGLGYL